MEVALVWIVLFISVAAVLIAMFRSGRERDTNPQELLARRYAAGEIDEAEYLTRLSILKEANELTP